jgi:hypothetical protein
MIIYNVTTKVASEIAGDWIHWLKQEHIPAIIATGYFTHAIILRLLEIDDAEGPTYAVQYFAKNQDNYNKYIDDFAGEMRQQAFKKWGDRFIAFRSLMQIVK